jgi:hypothetical protein
MKRTYQVIFDNKMYTPEDSEIVIESPDANNAAWRFFAFWEVSNRTAVAISRFIAKWNGYKLVKEKR